MLIVQLPLLHTVLIIESTEARTGKTATLHVKGITMNSYQFYTSLHPYFSYHFYSPHQQPPPTSRCLSGCGGHTPHHLCGSTGTCSSSECHEMEKGEGREGPH